MQVLAGDARGGDRGAHGLLIAIHLGGVEMPVAQRQRALHRRAAGIALHAKGAEAELGQADTTSLQILGLQVFHDGSRIENSRMRGEGRINGISLRRIGRY